MLLICPSCRSGLEVPDGTTALVRCPACKTVFAPADSAQPEPEDEEDTEEEKRPKSRRFSRDADDEDEDRPRSRRGSRRRRRDDDEDEDEKPENRDFDPEPEESTRRRSPSSRADDGLTPEEKAARRRAFDRAAWGATLIWISFALFMVSMALILMFFFESAFLEPLPHLIILAGVLGLLNWVLAAVGVGLCLSGPPVPGHWGYGIAAAVSIGVHFILLTVLVGQGSEFGISKEAGAGGRAVVRLAMIPTRLNATMFYITALVYPDNHGATPKTAMPLSMITGVAEMVRTVLIMMFLSRLARSALDEDLAHQCTRAAGIASAAPAVMALVIFLFVAGMIETNAPINRFTLTLFATVFMSVYAIVNGAILPCFTAAREVAEACDEPFQSLIPKL